MARKPFEIQVTRRRGNKPETIRYIQIDCDWRRGGSELCMFYPAPFEEWVLSIFNLVRSSLFVKVPQPGDNEETFSVFQSCYHLLLPV